VSAVRSIGKVSVAAWEVNAMHRERGCLSASGVFRSMYLLGVIVAGFLALWNVVGFTRSQIIYLQVLKLREFRGLHPSYPRLH
jgi:hypothetical protein